MKGEMEILGDIVSPVNEEGDWEAFGAETPLRQPAVRNEINRGIEQAERGEFVDGPRTLAKIREKIELRKRGKE